MAYFTEWIRSRDWTEAETASVNSYVASQVSAGTTDGNLYRWEIQRAEVGTQSVRMWGTTEAANGYKSLIESFTPSSGPVKVF